jgi:paraquat-inducible protein B
MSQSSSSQGQAEEIAPAPMAMVRTGDQVANRKLRTRLWWLTGLCIALSIGLVASSIRRQGASIQIRFKDGFGLKVGDTLRHRGIDCGSVTNVRLSEQLEEVLVEIQIHPGCESVAVEGSQFWIQRARLSLGQMSGLETVLGAKYVGVLPGKSQKPERNFLGLETPLAMTEGESTEIRIRFSAGEGLEVGNPVRHRGIEVGEVIDIGLSSDLRWVDVTVRLVGSSRQVAREGTQFWIESPRLELTEVRGLDTVLQGVYIALEPGAQPSKPAVEFVGLSEPPPLPRRPGSLEIELDASTRMGIVRGAPIVYRGLEVGKVVHLGLSKDGASVKVTGVVEADYAELVRENSKWWAVSGFNFQAGLTGVELSVESLAAWTRGGVAFATPPQPGKSVFTGHRFMLESKPQEEWLTWQPRIALGGSLKSRTGLTYPTAHRVVVSWKSTILGIGRRQTEQCWGLVLNRSALALPASFVASIGQANNGASLEIGGQSMPFARDKFSLHGAIAVFRFSEDWSGDSWSTEQVLSEARSDLVLQVINPELNEPLAIDFTRWEPMAGMGLKIAPGVPISQELQGSPVVDTANGKVWGLLCLTDNGWLVGALR